MVMYLIHVSDVALADYDYNDGCVHHMLYFSAIFKCWHCTSCETFPIPYALTVNDLENPFVQQPYGLWPTN